MKKSFSFLYIFPAIFFLFFISILLKETLFDLPASLEYERKRIENRVFLQAVYIQSHFTYFFRLGNESEIKKEISMLSLDSEHYETIIILDSDQKVLFSNKKELLLKNNSLVKQYLKNHARLRKVFDEKIYLSYETKPNIGEYFDVIIPINLDSMGSKIRLDKYNVVFFTYKTNTELQRVKDVFYRNIFYDVLFMAMLFSLGGLLTYFYGIRPIFSLLKAMQSFKKMKYPPNIIRYGFKEVQDLNSEFVKMSDELYKDFELIQKQKNDLEANSLNLLKFQRAAEQSPSNVIITDIKGNLEYVNPIFIERMGYSFDECIGQKFSLIHSGVHDKEFYKKLWHDLKKFDIWRGTFHNKTKEGKIVIVATTIFPLFNEQGKIINYICLQEDITKKVELDKALTFQSKQAQMGEMVSMIAHQWRQPLSTVNAMVATMEISINLDQFKKEDFLEKLKKIINVNHYLSQTINDFRNFYKLNKVKEVCSFEDIVTKSMTLIEHSISSNKIEFDLCIGKTRISAYENELVQVLLTLIKNSIDIFSTQDKQDKKVKIFTKVEGKYFCLIYQDNAGGINIKSIKDVFLPYFTTKGESEGTGLGLYMSKMIIEEHLEGKLEVMNLDAGVEFKIYLPKG